MYLTAITFGFGTIRLLEDPSTGTAWHPVTRQGVRGTLRDEPLAAIAWASPFDWAWLDFYPQSRIVG